MGVDSKTQPDIAGAIRRSRRAREQWRSRRRRSLALLVGAAVAGVAPMSLSLAGLNADDVVHAAVSQANNLADLLNARSPGERTEGRLTKTKQAHRALAAHRAPRNHSPALEALAPPPELAEILLGPPPLVPVDLKPAIAQVQLPVSPLLGAIGGGGGGGGGGGIVVGPPGGSPFTPPGGGNPASFPGPESREPIPAVPEPGTWAMMILGFGLIGWRIRRRAERAIALPA